jgi:hypothetical protein
MDRLAPQARMRRTADRSVRSTAVVIALAAVSRFDVVANAVPPMVRATTVPRVVGDGMLNAYVRLHRAGVRVDVPGGIRLEVGWWLYAVRVVPAAGSRVGGGSVVTLWLQAPVGAPSIAAPLRMPAYRVPDFRRRLASAAYDWVRGKTLLFAARLGPLHAATAPELFGNYQVTRQQPARGSIVRFATTLGGLSGVLTPLTVWGHQT